MIQLTHIDQQMDAFKVFLGEKGLKSTRQRDLILRTFLETKDHINVESLYQKVKVVNAHIGYATVYRTMKLLKEGGLVSERHFDQGHALYEPLHAEHHDHLICLKCHAIYEFSDDQIERLQDRIAKKFKFKLVHHKHELYGICRNCQ